MGDLASAETIQESFLKKMYTANSPYLQDAVETLTDIYVNFQRRAEYLDRRFKVAAGISVAYRVAMLDIPALNTVAYNRGLLPELHSEMCDSLHIAVKLDADDMAQTLLKRGANVNHKGTMGRTPLFEAARVENVDMTLLLIDHGADVQARDDDGRTALLEVVESSLASANVVKMLLTYGADV